MVKSDSQITRRARPAPRQPPARDGQTEQRILDGAHTVFLRRGTAGARMQDIAREAGVNPALLHYYFRSKERLAAAVFYRAAGDLMPAAIRILASDRPLAEKVREVVELELDQLSRSPFLPAYLISEMAHHPERMRNLVSSMTGMMPEQAGRQVLATLTRQIDSGVAAGTLRPIAADQFVVNLISLCIFPFAARPMLMALLGVDEAGFAGFIEHRRRELPHFFLGALRP